MLQCIRAGRNEYKFMANGQWIVCNDQPIVDDGVQTEGELVSVVNTFLFSTLTFIVLRLSIPLATRSVCTFSPTRWASFSRTHSHKSLDSQQSSEQSEFYGGVAQISWILSHLPPHGHICALAHSSTCAGCSVCTRSAYNSSLEFCMRLCPSA